MSTQANYVVCARQQQCMVLLDVGPWDKFMTVTNDAENVVAELFVAGALHGHRLFYCDSENEITELKYDMNTRRMSGFAPVDDMVAEVCLDLISQFIQNHRGDRIVLPVAGDKTYAPAWKALRNWI